MIWFSLVPATSPESLGSFLLMKEVCCCSLVASQRRFYQTGISRIFSVNIFIVIIITRTRPAYGLPGIVGSSGWYSFNG